MKTNDNTNRLKTYKIKNHDSGKTYTVKAVSYTDAVKKYNKHILKDSITEDAYTKYYLRRIRDKYTFSGVKGMWDEEIASYSFKKQENPDVFISIIKRFVDFNMTKSELLSKAPGFVMSFKDSTKDSHVEDAYVYPTHASTNMAASFAKLCVEKFGGKVGSKGGNKYVYIAQDKETANKAKQFLEEKYKTSLPTVEFIVADSITEDATLTHIENYKDVKIYQNNDNKKYRGTLYTNRFMPIVSFEEKDLKTLKAKIDEARNKYIKKYGNLDSLTEDVEDDTFIKASIDELSRYIRNWDFMSAKERNNIMPGYSKSEGLAKLKIKLANAQKMLKDSLTEDTSNIQISKSSKEFERVIREYHKKYGKILQVESMVYNFETGKYYMYNESTDYSFTSKRLFDSITEDADIAQNDIKSSYLPEDANADNIQYLGFNEKRKLSFYSYGDRYFVHHDLEGLTEEIDKETVQKILKKNILGEIDENDLINKEPQAEEIVSDSFEDASILTADKEKFKSKIRDILKDMSKDKKWKSVYGANNIIENYVWNTLKQNGELTAFPSNLYTIVRDVMYESNIRAMFRDTFEKERGER